MVNVKEYKEYWEQYKERIPEISEVVPMTVEQDISKKVQGIKANSLVLFMLVPEVKTDGQTVDDYEHKNEGVVILAGKFDPQRGGSYQRIEEIQPYIESIFGYILEDMAQYCPVLGRVDINSIRMIPVSTWYNVLAGWMIDFTFNA